MTELHPSAPKKPPTNPETNPEPKDYATLTPKAQPGEAGLFRSVQYHIDVEPEQNEGLDKVYRKTDFDNAKPLYVYTPIEKVALVRHVLEDKKTTRKRP